MDINAAFPSRWLKAADLKGKKVAVVISGVEMEDVGDKDEGDKPVVYFDIGCKDKDKTQEFYTKLFDWAPEEGNEHTVMLDTGEDGIPGAITSLGHEPHNYVMIYTEVDDIPAHLDKVKDT